MTVCWQISGTLSSAGMDGVAGSAATGMLALEGDVRLPACPGRLGRNSVGAKQAAAAVNTAPELSGHGGCRKARSDLSVKSTRVPLRQAGAGVPPFSVVCSLSVLQKTTQSRIGRRAVKPHTYRKAAHNLETKRYLFGT